MTGKYAVGRAGLLAAGIAAARELGRLSTRSGVSPFDVDRRLPGDDLVAAPSAVIDRAVILPAAAEDVWPWLVQLGKGRAGWYLPGWLEPAIPRGRRGLRYLEPRWQRLDVGDDIPDYGPGDPVFRAKTVDAPQALVYLSLRDRDRNWRWPDVDDPVPSGVLALSWALVLSDLGPQRSRLHVRLRMRTRGGPLPVELFGGLFDWVTIRLLFAGLAERVR